MNDESMKQLLAMMCVIDWLANDLHYNVRGPNFYELHLLADRIRSIGNEDELKEAYWLGWKNTPPPSDKEIAALAIMAYDNMQAFGGDYLAALSKVFELTISLVETCKKEETLPAGIHAILDGISQKALTYKFLTTSARLS